MRHWMPFISFHTFGIAISSVRASVGRGDGEIVTLLSKWNGMEMAEYVFVHCTLDGS